MDRTANTIVTQICHLSEYALIGGTKHVVYLPLVLKNYPQPLRINLGSYPEVIDPQKSSFTNEIASLRLIYEGLTNLDENQGTVPGAAESWGYNANATELTFTLRAGLQYSDGMALYAQAQQMITTDLPAAYMWNNLNAYLVKPRVQGVRTTPQDSDWAGSRVPLSITLR